MAHRHEANLVDWDYFPYLWVVIDRGRVCLKDINGYFYRTDQTTIGL